MGRVGRLRSGNGGRTGWLNGNKCFVIPASRLGGGILLCVAVAGRLRRGFDLAASRCSLLLVADCGLAQLSYLRFGMRLAPVDINDEAVGVGQQERRVVGDVGNFENDPRVSRLVLRDPYLRP